MLFTASWSTTCSSAALASVCPQSLSHTGTRRRLCCSVMCELRLYLHNPIKECDPLTLVPLRVCVRANVCVCVYVFTVPLTNSFSGPLWTGHRAAFVPGEWRAAQLSWARSWAKKRQPASERTRARCASLLLTSDWRTVDYRELNFSCDASERCWFAQFRQAWKTEPRIFFFSLFRLRKVPYECRKTHLNHSKTYLNVQVKVGSTLFSAQKEGFSRFIKKYAHTRCVSSDESFFKSRIS